METVVPPRNPTSARPAVTAAVMAETGLDEDVLHQLVHRFYGKVRDDRLLGPIFAARITDWPPHLERMVTFWSSVTLMTGQYHGRPVPAHTPLPIDAAHFDRWLALFRATADGNLHSSRCGPCDRTCRTHRPIPAYRRCIRPKSTRPRHQAVLTTGASRMTENRPDRRRSALTRHIETRYHARHREQLPMLAAMAERVEDVHFGDEGVPDGLSILLQSDDWRDGSAHEEGGVDPLSRHPARRDAGDRTADCGDAGRSCRA